MKSVAVRNLRLCTKDCLCLYVCPTGATDTENSVIDVEKCVGCGKCERMCPLNNIVMLYNKPAWKQNCSHCMACIENCPVDAIEYGERTQGMERYRISKYIKRFTGDLEWKDKK